ncbi:MAG: acyl carrier protein [Mycoplasmataceae bacterium]|jgi:acyl carrier protein|nr:acyl carrier protein [Mycoplasmataceae bacterium]
MDRAQIINILKEICAGKKVNFNEQKLDIDFKTLGLDSLQLVDLIYKVEERLNLQLPDQELMNIKTLNDIVNLLLKLSK